MLLADTETGIAPISWSSLKNILYLLCVILIGDD
jgi:hypothetical protein